MELDNFYSILLQVKLNIADWSTIQDVVFAWQSKIIAKVSDIF